MEPQIRFCTSADGTRIAYETRGEGPPLVNFPAWGGNIDLDWTHPDSRRWFERLGRNRRLVGIDRRGCAASQRDVDDFSLKAHVGDLAAVVDTLELTKFDLWGDGEGAAVCVAYAAQNPQRVSHLGLWSLCAWGRETVDARGLQALLILIRDNWSLARRTMADSTYPSGPVELQRWWADLLRQSMSPDVAARYVEFQTSLDIEAYLPQVQAPTLVLHRRGSRIWPISDVRAAAAMIPTCTFVLLDGDITNELFGDISYLETVRAFFDDAPVDMPGGEPAKLGTFRTILFTDVEGSTALTERLGDTQARDLLREHERITREALKAHGGSEVKTMGDGFMASFSSATKALECAISIQRAFAEHNDSADEPILVRIGLNAGEPIAEDEDLFGTAVNMAARICSRADGGQILAPIVVRELVAGKGFLLSDVGETELRGFEDPVRLYEVRWRD